VLAVLLVLYVAAPLVIFYALQAAGVSQVFALLAGAVVPVGAIVHKVATGGRIDGLDLFALGTLALSGVLAPLTGDPRLLLVKDSVTEAVSGGWALLTIASASPLALQVSRQLGVADREETWHRSHAYRVGVRVITALWGSCLLLDAALSMVLARVLPLGLLPLTRLSALICVAASLVAGILYARRFRRRHGHRLVVPDDGRVDLDYS
jgi:hypothetical protein